ncbi:MAG: hypothetical protein GX458_11650, partial [Phyllobacteriaceae bacterium]|nr:hypothetical protein [Phyllobacteriaceae bacterium]
PIVHVLDIAHPTEDADVHRPYLAAWASPWTGSLAVRRVFDGETTPATTTVDRPAVIGVTTTDLAPGPVWVWDRTTRLDVRLHGGTLAAASERLVLEGANRAAIRAASGTWEIVQFAGAELVAASTWRLSDFLRRQGGSDDAGAVTIPAGAPFVLLDDRLVVLPIGRDDVGREMSFLVGPAADPWTDPSWVSVVATPGARGLIPWSPAHPAATIDPAGGDVVFSWIRRSRVAGADSWTLLEVPLGAAEERWRLAVAVDGVSVLSVETTVATWTWPRAARDAALGPDPIAVTLSVTQIDPDWGDGVTRTAVLRV